MQGRRTALLLVAMVLVVVPASWAIWAGSGVSLEQGSLEGFVPVGGKHSCTGLLLTNEWVLTVKHCFGPGDRRWITLPDGSLTKIEVDTTQSYAMPSMDIRVMRLRQPVEINGLTSHFATRIRDERMLGEDGTALELGAGGTEFETSDIWHQSCEETSWSPTWEQTNYMKFEHDQHAGNFPVPDPRNIGCEYVGGDSGSATLYRDENTHEWFAVAVCPGQAEGACLKSSRWAEWVKATIWGDSDAALPGLSTTTPYRRAGERVIVHYDRGGEVAGHGWIMIAEPGCPADRLCRGVQASANGSRGSAELTLGADAPRGLHQIRYYARVDGRPVLLRVIGLRVGGAIRLANRYPRVGNDFEVEVLALDGEASAFVAVVSHGSDVRRERWLDFSFLNGSRDLPTPPSPLSSARLSFRLDRYRSHFGRLTFAEDERYDVVLMSDTASREEGGQRIYTSEVDRQMIRTRPNLWAPIQRGFNSADGIRLYVDGLDSGERISVTVRRPGKAAVSQTLSPSHAAGPAEYFAPPASPLLKGGVGPVMLRIERELDGGAFVSEAVTKIEKMSAKASGTDLEIKYQAADSKGTRWFSVWDGLPGAKVVDWEKCVFGGGKCEVSLDLSALAQGTYLLRAHEADPKRGVRQDYVTGVLEFAWNPV